MSALYKPVPEAHDAVHNYATMKHLHWNLWMPGKKGLKLEF